MEPYNKMIDEQENIARQMMDPHSELNRNRMQLMKKNQFDMLGQQSQDAMQQAYMMNVSPAQMIANQAKMRNQSMGSLGAQFSGLLGQQYNQGLGNLQNVMSLRQGEGERLSQAHINKVNAHNARRQSRMNMTTGLLGTAVSAFGGGGLFGDQGIFGGGVGGDNS